MPWLGPGPFLRSCAVPRLVPVVPDSPVVELASGDVNLSRGYAVQRSKSILATRHARQSCGNLPADMKLAPKLAKTLLELLAACLLIVLMLRWFEHSQVYHPDRVLTPRAPNWAARSRMSSSRPAMASNSTAGSSRPSTNSHRRHLAVLVCHGNAGNISHRLDTYVALLATGVNVFVFDYRGYGRSQGRPSEEGTYRDAQAAYEWLRQKGFAGTNIIAFGESLGGGVAAELAVREPSAGWCCKAPSPASRIWARNCFPGCRCAGSARSVTTRAASCRACMFPCW